MRRSPGIRRYSPTSPIGYRRTPIIRIGIPLHRIAGSIGHRRHRPKRILVVVEIGTTALHTQHFVDVVAVDIGRQRVAGRILLLDGAGIVVGIAGHGRRTVSGGDIRLLEDTPTQGVVAVLADQVSRRRLIGDANQPILVVVDIAPLAVIDPVAVVVMPPVLAIGDRRRLSSLKSSGMPSSGPSSSYSFMTLGVLL
jgi:hypothetical protein